MQKRRVSFQNKLLNLENQLMNVNWAVQIFTKKLKRNRGAGLDYIDASL